MRYFQPGMARSKRCMGMILMLSLPEKTTPFSTCPSPGPPLNLPRSAAALSSSTSATAGGRGGSAARHEAGRIATNAPTSARMAAGFIRGSPTSVTRSDVSPRYIQDESGASAALATFGHHFFPLPDDLLAAARFVEDFGVLAFAAFFVPADFAAGFVAL